MSPFPKPFVLKSYIWELCYPVRQSDFHRKGGGGSLSSCHPMPTYSDTISEVLKTTLLKTMER